MDTFTVKFEDGVWVYTVWHTVNGRLQKTHGWARNYSTAAVLAESYMW